MIEYDYEFNVLGILNYKKQTKLKVYYDWLRANHNCVDGDILEAGVYKGKSLLAPGLLMKSLNSNKIVYGYDSFSGFPPVYAEQDDLSYFEKLYIEGKISADHLAQHHRRVKHRGFIKNAIINEKNISSSETFEDSSKHNILRKIDYLNLTNIKLIEGNFTDTMNADAQGPDKISAALLDCDLYASYLAALEFIWPRLTSGGIIFFDEYFSLKFPGARIAVDEFLEPFSNDFTLKCYKSDDIFERWIAVKH